MAELVPLDATALNIKYSFFRQAVRRMWSYRSARIGFFVILFFVLVAICVPIFWPYDAKSDSNLPEKLQPPSWAHPFGTDQLGRDVFCLLYTSDAADDLLCVDLGGRRII